MKAEDKFGNPIFPSTFSKLVQNGKILLSSGYSESRNKPNLFYKRIPQGCLYADMRGTEEVPIWTDTRPLFYWNFNSSVPMWKRRRLIKNELIELYHAECPCRLSFFAPIKAEEFQNTATWISAEQGEYDWDDGYCHRCGKDFQGEGMFCSKDCAEEWYKQERIREIQEGQLITCSICKQTNKENLGTKFISHHISYDPEETVMVCLSCHMKIHRSDVYPKFKAKDKRISKKEQRRLEGLKRIQLLQEGKLSPNEYCLKCGQDFIRYRSYTFYKGKKIHVHCLPEKK
jgi:hypothetical protein